MPILVFHPKNMMKSVQAKPKYLFYELQALLALEFAHLHQCSAVLVGTMHWSALVCTGVPCSARTYVPEAAFRPAQPVHVYLNARMVRSIVKAYRRTAVQWPGSLVQLRY